MPFTPLHLGAALPIKILAKDRFSLGAFIAVQLLIDLEPAIIIASHSSMPLHGAWHTLNWMLVLALLVTLFYPGKKMAVFISAVWGAVSHAILDSNMHSDVEAFRPFIDGNPLYGLVDIGTVDGLLLGLVLLSLPLLDYGRLGASYERLKQVIGGKLMQHRLSPIPVGAERMLEEEDFIPLHHQEGEAAIVSTSRDLRRAFYEHERGWVRRVLDYLFGHALRRGRRCQKP